MSQPLTQDAYEPWSLTPASPLAAGVGAVDAARMEEAFGFTTVGDLIEHWPRRWRERGQLSNIGDVPIGEPITVHAVVTNTREVTMRNGKRKLLMLTLRGDDGATFGASLFSPWQAKKDGVKVGASLTLSGKVAEYKGTRKVNSPEYVLDSDAVGMAGTVVTVYPATKTCDSAWIAERINAVLDLIPQLPDPVPADVVAARKLMPYDQAVRTMHTPDSEDHGKLAKKRLTYDEALRIQLVLALRRVGVEAQVTKPRPGITGGVGGALAHLDASLPFALTDGQQQACEEIFTDLADTAPMNCLVLGEVGSGKTIVALRTALRVVDSGGQVAFIAPTEVLATQHYKSIVESLGHVAHEVDVRLLTGSMTGPARREVLNGIAEGHVGLVVGTHAVLSKQVKFADLGLVIVDEQHRFGVQQRAALRDRGVNPPHLLVMTATPIPRTVAMTLYGDLKTIQLQGLPGGRKPIQTHVVPLADHPSWNDRIWGRIAEECAQGSQAFIVVPRVEASEEEDTGTTVETESESIPTLWDDEDAAARPPVASIHDMLITARERLPHLRIEAMYGSLDPAVKDEVMARYAAGQIDVLISTTVIEVGVNVPNATTMVIWDADRFGVAQAHQLRGRVGRGSKHGLCLLVTTAPQGSPARARLDSIAGTLDGYELSMMDLKQRREGNILGAGQAGRSGLKLLDLLHGERVIKAARDDAEKIVRSDPALRAHPGLRAAIDKNLSAEERAWLARG